MTKTNVERESIQLHCPNFKMDEYKTRPSRCAVEKERAMKNTSKLNLFAGVVLRALLLIVPVSASLAGNDQEIGETYSNQMYQTEGRVDSAVLAPTGDRLYTLNNGVLRQYNLSPLGIVTAIKVAFDSRQTKEDPYKIFITNDEKRIIIYSKKQLRLLDLKTGKMIKTVPFQSELGVLNDNELFTLDNDIKATVWNAYELTKKKEFLAFEKERWTEDSYYTITGDTLIKAANHIILNRPSTRSHGTGKVFVFDAASYHQILNIDHNSSGFNAISYDLNTLYVGNDHRPLRLPEKTIEHIGEFIKKNKGARIGEVLKIDIATAKVEYVFKENYKWSHYIMLAPYLTNLQISPTRQYHVRGSDVFIYREEEKERQKKRFLQFEDGEVAFIGQAGHFQGTEHARKHLKMKNSRGKIVPINDVTFEKFNKTNTDHKDW